MREGHPITYTKIGLRDWRDYGILIRVEASSYYDLREEGNGNKRDSLSRKAGSDN